MKITTQNDDKIYKMHEKHSHNNEQQQQQNRKKITYLVPDHSHSWQWKQVHFTL